MKNDSKFSDGDAGAGGQGKYQALPKGWQCMKLGDIATIRKEKFIITANNNHLPCIELEHIEKHSGKIIATASVANKLSIKNTFYAGDVLYGKLRPNLRKYAFPQFKGVCASEIWALKVNTDFCINKFLFYVIQSEKFTEVACRTTGTKMPRADWSLLRNFSIFIPNKNTQNKIVSILETWDTAIEKTERLIAAKEKRFKYLLKTLISDQQNNPDWKKVKLGDICLLKKGCGLSKEAIKNTGKNKCILYGQLYTTYPEIINKVISSTDFNDSTISQVGDILIPGSTTTSSIDLANATALLESGVLLGGDINILRANKIGDYCPSFLAYYLTHVKKYEIAQYAQGITIVHLYGRDIKKINLSLPKLSRQKQIANILNMAKQEITTLQNISEKYRTQKRGLMQKLLTENTKGKH